MPSFSRAPLSLVPAAAPFATPPSLPEEWDAWQGTPGWTAAPGWTQASDRADEAHWADEVPWGGEPDPAAMTEWDAAPVASEAWRMDALCAETDPEAFFPEKGGSTRDAKRVCGGCPVRAECLEFALAGDERFGIWGGLSERERRRVRQQRISA